MIKADLYYKQNLEKILNEGCRDENPRPKYKDGTPAHSDYITQVFEEYDINKGEFPITTLRNTAIKTGIKEIIWIYQKQTSSLEVAHQNGINWWDEWNIGDNTIGQRYGATIRKWNLMDELLYSLTLEPFSRRHIINMYQEEDLKQTKGLFPCAYETIWSVRKVNEELFLDLTLIQRSNDYIMAGYINKIQYVALQMMVALHVNMKVGKFCHYVNNLHIYDRHIEAAKEILERTPLTIQPKIELIREESPYNFYSINIEDFKISNIKGIEKLKSDLEIAI
jgi:thymidylate synthase